MARGRSRLRATSRPRTHHPTPRNADDRDRPITGALIENPISVLDTGPIWEPHTLAMAEVIRKGGNEIHVLPSPPRPRAIINPVSLDYVARIMNLRDRYSVILFTPSDPALYAEQLKAMAGRVETGLRSAEVHAQRTKRLTNAAIRTKAGPTLYAAIDAYALYAEKSKHGGPNEPRDAKSLTRVIQDMPLVEFRYDEIQRIGDYWRSRPPSRRHGSKGAAISVQTVRGRLKTTARFVMWLSRSSSWDWRAPAEWEQAVKIDVAKIQAEAERLAGATGPDTWTDDDLVTLHSDATDRERLLILLGLNFGFAQSEIRSFRQEDIKLKLKFKLDPPRVARLRSKTQRSTDNAAGLPGHTVLDGNRRRDAAVALGWTKIDVLMRHDLADAGVARVSEELLDFNSNRRQLAPFDQAVVLVNKHEIEIDRLAKQWTGDDVNTVTAQIERLLGGAGNKAAGRYVRIAMLPQPIQDAFRTKRLRQTLATKICAVKPVYRSEIADAVVAAIDADAGVDLNRVVLDSKGRPAVQPEHAC